MSTEFRGNATAGLNVKAGPTAGDELSPGEHLRAEIERLGLDQVAVSNATGVSRQSINNIVNGRQPISRAMAGKLGRLTGHSSDYWLQDCFVKFPAGANKRRKPRADDTAPRPFGVGVLVNHQIARAVHDGIIGIDPFDENNIQLASIDLTVDEFIITTDGEKVDITDGQSFMLKQGRTICVGTKEWVEFPYDYIGRVGGMAQHARFGIVTSHGFQIDPGFKGNLQFCIFNAGPKDFELRSGMPIISLEIMPLSATPSFDERAERHLSEAHDRGAIISMFRHDVCDRIVRDALRAGVKVDLVNGGAEATIAKLGIMIFDESAKAAIDGAVECALQNLYALRHRPDALRDLREEYLPYFGAIAERLYLNGEQVRGAIACLGLKIDSGHTLFVTLPDGGKATLGLPPRSTKISLAHIADQLRLNAADLILALTGLQKAADLKLTSNHMLNDPALDT
jgi:dCTP deaminase